MFRQLKIRLLLMNLGMITVLMLAAFTTIYFMTYNNIHESINRELYRESDTQKLDFRLKDDIASVDMPKDDISRDDTPRDDISNYNIFDAKNLENRSLTFSIQMDKEKMNYQVSSFFQEEDGFYQAAVDMVNANNTLKGTIDLDGKRWAYLITTHDRSTNYAFVDMSTQQEVLDRLIMTFVIVTIFMIIAILGLSYILMNKSIQPIREAFENQKTFVSDASHELKTPLAVIGTNVEVLLQNNPRSEDSKWLNYIKSEVSRMSQLTNDLLYLTQVENVINTKTLYSKFNMTESLETLLLGLEAVCFEKSITLDFELEQDIDFFGSKEQIMQVVLVLLDNGIKYTSLKGSLNVVLKKSNHWINIIVTNTGEGIKPEDINHIFDRFYRADKTRSRQEGSYGLGLAIAKAIILQHQGKITCESELNHQTTFNVRLPI